MKRWRAVIVGLALVIGAAAGAIVTRQFCRSNNAPAPDSIRAFCLATRDAVRKDRVAFETGVGREEAYQRFLLSNIEFHGMRSVVACANPMPRTPLCFHERDWPCVARFALEVEQSISDGR